MPIRKSSIVGGAIPSGTTADRPLNPSVGDQFVNGTLGITEIYTETNGWQPLTSAGSGIPYGESSSRPENPSLGQPYFNANEARLELYTAENGWQNIVQETPSIVTISTATPYLEFGGAQSVTISGTNFSAGCSVVAVGSNGVEVSASSVSLVSVVEAIAEFSGLASENAPYDIKLINPSNLYGILYDCLPVDDSYIWSKPSGSLGTFIEQSEITTIATSIYDSVSSPLTFSVSSGQMPNGLSLDPITGEISGTPSDVIPNTTYSFSVSATDGNSIATRSFSISITDHGPTWQTPQTLSSFTKGVPYSQSLLAIDDNLQVVAYSLISGSLPDGVSLNQSTGLLSGTPTSYSEAVFTVRATDTNSGAYTDQNFTIPNTGPVWQTSEAILMFSDSNNIQLSAIDDSGITPTYDLLSGSLPPGVSLSSSGLLSGPASGSDGQQFVFVVKATDSLGNKSDRQFTATIKQRLYQFTSHTFTNAGASGPYGPSLSSVRAAYSTSWDETYLGMTYQGIQEWTVPISGTYRITATGARGANGNGTSGGSGARVVSDVTLTASSIVLIAVGQQGTTGNGTGNWYAGGGGGGTFVALKNSGLSSSTPLVVAGGGGGAAGYSFSGNNAPSTLYTSYSSGSGVGGTGGGNGGSAGSGFDTNGGSNVGDSAFKLGANGDYSTYSSYNYGGFGGGGEGGGNPGGGGGGFTGGNYGNGINPSNYDVGANGGTNFAIGANSSVTVGVGTGHGSVTIELL